VGSVIGGQFALHVAGISFTAGAILGAGALLKGRLRPKTSARLEATGFVLIGIGGVFGFWTFFSEQGAGGLFWFLLASVLIPLAILVVALKRAAGTDVAKSHPEDDQ
jgi:hypothetical protein